MKTNLTWAYTNKIYVTLQEQINNIPDVVTRCLQQCWERTEQRRNFLHPDTAAVPTPPSTITPYAR